MIRCVKFLLCGVAIMLGIGCTDFFSQGSKDRDQLTEKEQEKINEMKAEVELGRNMAGRLLQFYGTYGDENLAGYINQVGNYVAGYGDYPERRYMFAIIENDAVNAFACPGGYILVTLGTLRNAKTEAELAMVLGHEVAHVGKQHMFNTLKAMSEKDREKEAQSVDKKGDAQPLASAVRQRPSADNSEAGNLLARYLSGATGAGLSILQAAKAGMNLILEKGLDKELEYEADREGVKYAVRAGYEPNAMLAFFDRVQAEKKKKGLDTKILEKTHPKVEDRRKRVAELLEKMNTKEMVGADGKARFESQVDSLPPPKNKKAGEKE